MLSLRAVGALVSARCFFFIPVQLPWCDICVAVLGTSNLCQCPWLSTRRSSGCCFLWGFSKDVLHWLGWCSGFLQMEVSEFFHLTQWDTAPWSLVDSPLLISSSYSPAGLAKGKSAMDAFKSRLGSLEKDYGAQDDALKAMSEWTISGSRPGSRPSSATEKQEKVFLILTCLEWSCRWRTTCILYCFIKTRNVLRRRKPLKKLLNKTRFTQPQLLLLDLRQLGWKSKSWRWWRCVSTNCSSLCIILINWGTMFVKQCLVFHIPGFERRG